MLAHPTTRFTHPTTRFTHPTTRFSSRVANYVRFRPAYPPAVVELLARHAGLTPDSVIADIGSGTGLLGSAFLHQGHTVIGVEPNREMREAGDTLLARYPSFRSLAARAEATTLPDGAIDLIVAGQAFHWFDVPETRREWLRILKPNHLAALIWNERDPEATAFMRETEALIDTCAAALDPDGTIREGGRSRIPALFAPSPVYLNEFPNTQHLDLEGLLGRVASCSYIPHETDPQYPEMSAELARIFDRHQQNGRVTLHYRTKVYWAPLT